MTPVPGHSFVLHQVSNGPNGPVIDCACQRCRQAWQKECEYPQRVNVWINKFCTEHCHGNVALREEFKRRYHQSVMQQRG